MEYFERVKELNNAWEPELCRHSVDRAERVCMDIYHTGALAPERYKMTMERATDYISGMAAVMDIKSMLTCSRNGHIPCSKSKEPSICRKKNIDIYT